MIQAGLEDEVLSSQTIWACASCYPVPSAAPDIEITDVMTQLRNLALQGATRRARAGPITGFMSIVRRADGCGSPSWCSYNLTTNPLNLWAGSGGLKMLRKRKLRSCQTTRQAGLFRGSNVGGGAR